MPIDDLIEQEENDNEEIDQYAESIAQMVGELPVVGSLNVDTNTFTPSEDTEPTVEEIIVDRAQPVADLSSLVSKTVFLRVSYGSIGNSRKVPNAQVLTTDADSTLLRVSKTLMESAELDAIRTHDTELRKWLGRTCLPYDIGIMLLPIGLIQTAEAKLIEHKAQREELIDAFVKVYPSMKEEAQKQLGTLYNESEYPSIDEVRFKFKFSWQYINFGVPGQLQKINPELYRQEQEKAQLQLQEAASEVVAVMRGTLLELVEHLKERLTPSADGKKKILKETAVTKLKEFLDTFDIRNVTDDKALSLEVQKVRSLLGGTTAVALRNSDEFREKLRKGMDNVTTTLGTMVEEKSGRKFRE